MTSKQEKSTSSPRHPYRIRKVVVLGSGVMGSQIAAHCVNAGLEVTLLDLKSDDPKRPNMIAERAVAGLLKLKPAPLALPEWSKWIRVGNFEDDFEALADADWICEVVVERMDVKREILTRIEAARRPGSIVSSNTSGLPISEISTYVSSELQAHFLGTHFFNPPRYMRLLELIPTGKTSPVVLDYMTGFCERVLGKGVVVCKDTPNFIANRIGVFSMASMLPWYFQGTFGAEEIDYLTGTLTGYSKAATFRTADMAGLDVLGHVAANLHPAIPGDERRDVFKLPELFGKMIAEGRIGNKAGKGFYQKVESGGKREFLVLDAGTMEYRAQSDPSKNKRFEHVLRIEKETKGGSAARLAALVRLDEPVGDFLWQIHADLLLYAVNRIPEIAESVESVDRAMKWGFNWELGPFERWDAIGVKYAVERMEKEGRTVPASLKAMLASGREKFYENGTVYDLASGKASALTPTADGEISVALLRAQGREVYGNESLGLYDMGDGIALMEFRTRFKTLGFGLMESMDYAMGLVARDFDALVIGHDDENFSYGANLMEAAKAVEEGRHERIVEAVERFQRIVVGLRYQPFPVVAAVSGMAFGGGTEILMHCDRVVAHLELYSGLVELGVGLIPAGGGTKEMLLRKMSRIDFAEDADPLTALKSAFKTISMAKTSDSAYSAQQLGYLRQEDVVVMNRALLLTVAKTQARALADSGYQPPSRPELYAMGRTGLSALQLMLYVIGEAHFASPYDLELAARVANVLSGGELSEPAKVSEEYVLRLEREAILACFQQAKTQERIKHMLTTGKPLRN